MLQFTNGFYCAMDQEKGELIIEFIQQIPEIGVDTDTTNVKTEKVSTMVMGRVMAKNLLNALDEMLKTGEEEEK